MLKVAWPKRNVIFAILHSPMKYSLFVRPSLNYYPCISQRICSLNLTCFQCRWATVSTLEMLISIDCFWTFFIHIYDHQAVLPPPPHSWAGHNHTFSRFIWSYRISTDLCQDDNDKVTRIMTIPLSKEVEWGLLLTVLLVEKQTIWPEMGQKNAEKKSARKKRTDDTSYCENTARSWNRGN